MALTFPDIDPIALQIGPLAIRWYALAYLAGFLLGWRLCMRLARGQTAPSPKDYDDYLVWAVIGTVLGGRLGYVLFYQGQYYLADPLEALKVWQGGMSFHGGAVGVIVAALIFRRRKFSFLTFADLLACAPPIGLFFGRLANFVNGELFGRPADGDLPWAMIFPRGGAVPRHPSQLYEALLEGALLFGIMMLLVRQPWVRARPGLLTGTFLAGYASFRSLAEIFREPDDHIGFLYGHVTMGQMLSLPMLAGGVVLVMWVLARARKT